jgi:hypothetical protein
VACRHGRAGLGEQRGEPLHPPVDRHVVDLDAALGQQLLKVAVGQAVPEVPPDRESDHVRREPEPGERRSLNHRHRHPPSTHTPTLPQPTDKRAASGGDATEPIIMRLDLRK